MRAAALCILLVGCSLDETGLGPFDAALADASAPAEGAAQTEAAADAPAPDTSGDCSVDLCRGERCTAGSCDYYSSCAAMHAADPTRATGLHHFVGGNGPFDAWCDMDTDSGGWTLAARSVSFGSSSSFGWFNASNSDPTDRATPYSLAAPAMGIAFTSALVGQVNEGAPGPNAWGANVNRVALPSGFPGNFQSSAGGASVTVITTSAGCTSSQVTMLGDVGYASHSAQFFFRDNTADGPYGLMPNVFSLSVYDCHSATMSGTPGMIMVR